jgi:hypothetical protein
MKSWFEVSDNGWKRMNAGRSMGHLIREAISNSFDQADVHKVEVTLQTGYVCIEDDSAIGIPNPELISVIFLTDKEESHLKRGRKGRGLKELISVADIAIVETIGLTVTFDQNGRKEEPNQRTKGTKISIRSALDTWKQTKEALEYLRLIIPPKELIINGQQVIKPELLMSFPARLETTKIEDGIQTDFYSDTTVNVYRAAVSGWFFEMGIPIQKISCPYYIDVQQRVPMNDNRDTLNQSYVRDVTGEVIDHIINQLTKDDLRADWVTECVWDIKQETKLTYATKLIGPKSALKGDNKRANDVAKEHGLTLIDLDAVPNAVRTILLNGALTAEAFAKKILEQEREILITTLTPEMQRLAAFTEWLGEKVLGRMIKCKFMEKKPDYTGFMTAADYSKEVSGRAHACSVIRFNLLAKLEIDKPLSPNMLSIVIHEFAHEYTDEHEREFTNSVEKVAGKLCFVLLHYRQEIMERFVEIGYIPGKTTFIECTDCGTKREVKMQDVHQVLRCLGCQRSHQNQKRRQRREYLSTHE